MTDWQARSPVELGPGAAARLDALEQALAGHPHAPIGGATRWEVGDLHLADSLSGLVAAPVREAGLIADLGAGAGLPGLVIAACRPDARVELIEASSRKSRVALEIAETAGIGNVSAIDQRSEEWARAGGKERYAAVLARAVGSLGELCELASPLLADGGALVAWKGPAADAEAGQAAAGAPLTGMHAGDVVPVQPYPESTGHRICIYRKAGPTPDSLPRRPGLAHKRPLGS